MGAADPLLVALAWLGTYLLHSSFLLLTAWTISRSAWLQGPRSKERLWRLALLGGLLTASVQIGTGTIPALGRLALHSEELAAGSEREQGELQRIPPAPGREDAERRRARTPGTTQENHRTVPVPATLATTDVRSTTRDAVPATRGAWTANTVELESAERRTAPRTQPRHETPGTPGATPTTTNKELEFGAAHLPAASTSTPVPHSWKWLVLGTWGLLGILGLLGFLWAWSRLIARIADRREVTSGPLLDELRKLSKGAGARRRVRLFASPSLEGPITYGWLGHRICVPLRCMTDLSPAQQSSMLAHELAHALRRDPLWFSVYALVERIFFFQPLNRLARRELHDHAELLCDDWAVRWTGERLALASCLTEIAGWIVNRRPLGLPAAGMAAQPSRLGRRVERLLDDRRSPTPEPRRRWWSPAALTTLAVVSLAAPGVSSSATRPAEARPKRITSPADSTGSPASAPQRAALRDPVTGNLGRQPVRTTATTPRASLAIALELESSLLDTELGFLRSELDALRGELDGTRAFPRFANALHQLENRIEQLHNRRDQLMGLIQLVQQNSTRPRQPEPRFPSKGTVR